MPYGTELSGPIVVLYVEDDRALATLVRKALKRRGHSMEHVTNSADALARIAEGGIDVVALDHTLPGETGIDSFCRRYVECGGTYYADSQACLDETFGYWGECPSRRAALDAFGACMSELDCSEWNPDAYNPGSTPCAQQWSDLMASPGC